ncbi:hypothetical protein [Runella sp. SP2]|uniref:hypothetical protein n=1 Tax=Runella sp. SP2 TaxID=2268026 RepID=UPI000F095E07|nr:hypothetical protein [Runella sp. SP2]AYQ34793.1 hypothetical protein DTQ70_22620 [Runella sp. SP2]
MSSQQIYANFKEFLIQRNWNLHLDKPRYEVFSPPKSLSFGEDYLLYLPKKYYLEDFEASIIKLIEVLNSIYEESSEELESIILEDKEIISFHIEGEKMKSGKVSIATFPDILSKIRRFLHETAAFTVSGKPHILEQIEEAERYINLCNFLRNDKGSLITKIELPKNDTIKMGNIFESQIQAREVNKKAIDILSFVNKDLLDSETFEDSYLKEHKSFINVNVIDAIRELYNETDLADLEVELKGVNKPQKTLIKGLNKDKIDTLRIFTKNVKEKINEIFEETIYGKVVELSSKDIDGEKNKVKMRASIRNIDTNVVIYLNSYEYQKAIEAHKNNRVIQIEGTFEKEKTQYRVTKLGQFDVL